MSRSAARAISPESTDPTPSGFARCTRCTLPAAFPRVQFDSEGVCRFCREAEDDAAQAQRHADLAAQLEAALRTAAVSDGEYACIVAYSGG